MHDIAAGNGTAFLHYFVCEIVPEAKKLCRLLSTSTSRETTVNTAASKQQRLHWDQLAVAAYQRGWVVGFGRNAQTAVVSRDAARTALQRYYNSMGMSNVGDFNVSCLSPTNMEMLLNRSLQYEYETVPDFFHSERGENQIRSDFAKDSFFAKFCNIDVNATLGQQSDEWWRAFFASI
jgi:hypothetical protein